jgi:small subunit ribosomal protein S2
VLNIGIKELLEAGVHFGHQTKRWNPKMKRYIFDARNGIHIIDLSKTLTQLEAACNFLTDTVRKGGEILFVGTKKQAQETIKDAAKTCGQHFVTERWLGGTLTNFNTIRRSIKRLKDLEAMETDGRMDTFGKQEQSMLRREANRLNKNLEGIRSLEKYPAAMFIVDIKREAIAVAEGRRLKIPISAIVDTNCDPDMADLPIAGNDDAIRSLKMIMSVIVQQITQARAEYEAKSARRKAEEEAKKAEEARKKASPAETTRGNDSAATRSPGASISACRGGNCRRGNL